MISSSGLLLDGLSVVRQATLSKFLTSCGPPLLGPRAVRNADGWPVGPQIGHSAVKRLDDSIQTEFNVLTGQLQSGIFNAKKKDWITCCTR